MYNQERYFQKMRGDGFLLASRKTAFQNCTQKCGRKKTFLKENQKKKKMCRKRGQIHPSKYINLQIYIDIPTYKYI